MKKFMLAVAVLAVASMSLVSCGKKDAKATAEGYAKEYTEAKDDAAKAEVAGKIAEWYKGLEGADKATADSVFLANAVEIAAPAAAAE